MNAIPQSPSIQTLPPTKIGKDGRASVLIPAGEFQMGSESEKPVRRVYMDAFYLNRYPVMNAEYKAFVDATKHRVPDHWKNGKIPQGKENHPATYVSWDDAMAYALWAGGRLPTEAEWEKAASWDGVKHAKRVYPWGDTFDKDLLNAEEGGKNGTTPVGSYPGGASPYGVLDMAGNVWEWCADWYDENYTRVVRGGSWHNALVLARCDFRFRYDPAYRSADLGFRLVLGE